MNNVKNLPDFALIRLANLLEKQDHLDLVREIDEELEARCPYDELQQWADYNAI